MLAESFDSKTRGSATVLPSTRTVAFISWFEQGEVFYDLIRLDAKSDDWVFDNDVDKKISDFQTTHLLMPWPENEKYFDEIYSSEEANKLSLESMQSYFKEQWPHGFSDRQIKPFYMRKSTPEELALRRKQS